MKLNGFTGVRALLAAALLGMATSCPAQGPEDELGRAFIAHYSAANSSRAEPIDSIDLSPHPLYPWLQAKRLANALAAKDPGAPLQVAAYLALEGEAPHTRELRRALLGQFADISDWQSFMANWSDSATNPALRCQRANAQLALGNSSGLAGELAAQWQKADGDLPNSCDAPLAWLLNQPEGPAAALARARTRLLDADVIRARRALAYVSAEQRVPLEAWAKLLANPTQELKRLASGPQAEIDAEGLSDVWLRYARKSPEDAASLLPALLDSQNPQALARGWIVRNTALPLAWERSPEALTLFRQVPLEALNDASHEWRIRSALWAQDYALAARWIRELPPAMASQQRWRYWLGRSLQLSGKTTEAKTILVPLSGEFDSFGMFAAAALNVGYTPIGRPIALLPAQETELANNPAVARAKLAYGLGLSNIAAAEWRQALTTLSPGTRPGLLQVAASMGWYAQAISTGSEVKVFDDVAVLYPRPWLAEVRSAAAQSGTAEEWIYSVMRRESAFRADARSGADALGLLQLLPGTAKGVARRHGLPAPSRSDLLVPEINLPLGAHFLAELQGKYSGNWLFTLAAYNAGPSRVPKWKPPTTLPADVWVECIPFNETRGYLQRILMHAAVYQYEASGQPVDVNLWLPPITP